jgi:hypothetical protein
MVGRRVAAAVALLVLVGCAENPAGSDRIAASRATDPTGRVELASDGRGPAPLGPTGAAASVSAADANTIVIGAPAENSNLFPFGGGFNASNRYQQAYAASAFGSATPLLIKSVSFLRGQGVLLASTYTLSLSTIPKGIDNLSTTDFVSNLGADNSLFAIRNLSGPAPATLTIQGTTPFLYDPSAGNLLLDIVVSPGGATRGDGATYLARSTALGITSRYHNFGSGFVGWGLVTQFEVAPLTIDNVIVVVNAAIARGSLTGAGEGNSADQRLSAWLNLLDAAQKSAPSGNDAGPCGPLEQVYVRADGAAQPPDFVTGPSAPSIAALVQGVRATLGCPK